jgi:hypothetical protein
MARTRMVVGWREDLDTLCARLVEQVAGEIRRDAELHAPVRTGRGARSYGIRVRSRLVRWIGSSLEYMTYVELGSLPHFITGRRISRRTKSRKILRWVDDMGVVHFARWVHHPGARAQPHLRPALYRERVLRPVGDPGVRA